MLDQTHFERALQNLQEAAYDPESVYWPAVAVALMHSSNAQRLTSQLARDSSNMWRTSFQHGDYADSLYLSPKGMPFYVDYGGHDTLYAIMMNIPQHTLNMAGWIHVSDGHAHISVHPTVEQRRWLDSHRTRDGEVFQERIIFSGLQRRSPNEAVDRWDVRPPTDKTDPDRYFQRLVRPTLSLNFGAN